LFGNSEKKKDLCARTSGGPQQAKNAEQSLSKQRKRGVAKRDREGIYDQGDTVKRKKSVPSRVSKKTDRKKTQVGRENGREAVASVPFRQRAGGRSQKRVLRGISERKKACITNVKGGLDASFADEGSLGGWGVSQRRRTGREQAYHVGRETGERLRLASQTRFPGQQTWKKGYSKKIA